MVSLGGLGSPDRDFLSLSLLPNPGFIPFDNSTPPLLGWAKLVFCHQFLLPPGIHSRATVPPAPQQAPTFSQD